MALDAQDKKFISDMFDERFEEKFEQKFSYHFGLMREDFNHKFAIMIELLKDKPGREEVREIVREEGRYVVRDEMKRFIAPYLRKKGVLAPI